MMNFFYWFALSLVVFQLFILSDTDIIEAHIPFITGTKHSDFSKAFKLRDIETSSAIYQVHTSKNPESYIAFDGGEGERLHMHLGVPVIEGLEKFRPSVHVIPPSVPVQHWSEPRFRARVESFETDEIVPTFFHEPFTKTNSWVLLKTEVTLTENGEYFIVSRSESHEQGKLWVAIGYKERFGLSNWTSVPATIMEVRSFHQPEAGRSSRFSSNLLTVALFFVVIAGSVATVMFFAVKKMRHTSFL